MNVNDFLEHHGIKGQKWGVITKETTLTRSELTTARKNVRTFTTESLMRKYSQGFGKRISEVQYKQLSTKTETLRKGQNFTRITLDKNDSFRGPAYVSYKPGDKDIYRSLHPMNTQKLKLGGEKTYTQNYEVTYKALETLRSPSEKERVDAYIKILKTPSIRTKSGKIVTGQQFVRGSFPIMARTMNSQQLGLRVYKDLAKQQGDLNKLKSVKMNDAYFKELQKRGYNSFIDDNDRFSYSQAPLVVLNPNGSLKKMSTKALTADDVNKAQLRLKSPPKEG